MVGSAASATLKCVALQPAWLVALVIAGLMLPASRTAALDIHAVNDAQWSAGSTAKPEINPTIVKGQVLLGRAGFSPGEIDGKLGDNYKKAIEAFAAESNQPTAGDLNEDIWKKLVATSDEVILKEYVILDDDVKGPFVEDLPAKMEQMKDLPALGYKTPREKIAEKFHMSEELLAQLNPGQKFDQAGQRIIVANARSGPLPKITRIEVNKTKQTLKAFDRNGALIAFYPVTAGSAEKPAPSDRLKITGVSKNPTYRYDPAYSFRGVKAQEAFTIKPGPNNPVGLVWIALSAKSYGIHGTPDPSKVSKSESHGCIRLTNWDALQLASAVAKGVPVDFIGDERAREQKAKKTKARRR
jgi:lipoprotein-anchoring transpeptidase ErfK/SrfK